MNTLTSIKSGYTGRQGKGTKRTVGLQQNRTMNQPKNHLDSLLARRRGPNWRDRSSSWEGEVPTWIQGRGEEAQVVGGCRGKQVQRPTLEQYKCCLRTWCRTLETNSQVSCATGRQPRTTLGAKTIRMAKANWGQTKVVWKKQQQSKVFAKYFEMHKYPIFPISMNYYRCMKSLWLYKQIRYFSETL